MGGAAIPIIGAGLGLASSLLRNQPQQYRQTPFQQQYGNWLMGNIQRGRQTMNPQEMAAFQQAYAVPPQAQWAANIMPQMFGGNQGFGGFGMPQSAGWGGQGGGGFGINPFAMPWQ